MDLSKFGLPSAFGGSKKSGGMGKQVQKPAWVFDDDDEKPKSARVPVGDTDSNAFNSTSTKHIETKEILALHTMALHPMLLGTETGTAQNNQHKSFEARNDSDSSELDEEEGQDEDESLTENDGGEDEFSDGPGLDYDVLPVTKQISLVDHRRTVSALTLDPAGARLVSGGRDCTIKLWDFHGMNEAFRPFRSIDEPCGGNPIRDLQFSNSGDQFLIASGSNQVKLYDREGTSILEFNKGDMYLRDMKHTKGHISALTCCKWHPNDRNIFLTGSLDGSIRIWNVENKRENKSVIAVKSKDKGGRTAITAATYSPDGKMVAGVGQDGEFRIWGSNGPFVRPDQTIEKAHIPGSVTSSVVFSIDNLSIITRSNDDTVKLWDIRNFKGPIAVANSLPSFYEESNAIFSPNDKLVITGVSVKKDEGPGKIAIFNKSDLSLVRNVDVGPGSVVKVLWNGKINQICASTTEGAVHVLYDEHVSVSGAKFCAGKKARGKSIDDLADVQDDSGRIILNPHALPMYRDDNFLFKRGGKRKVSKIRADPVATRKPDRPITGPGRGGKVGTNLTNHIMKGLIKDTTRDEDPREAILKYADKATSDPYWIAPAYKKTQPQAVMAEKVYEDEDEEDRASKKKRPN